MIATPPATDDSSSTMARGSRQPGRHMLDTGHPPKPGRTAGRCCLSTYHDEYTVTASAASKCFAPSTMLEAHHTQQEVKPTLDSHSLTHSLTRSHPLTHSPAPAALPGS
jgi:hypothetical protein